MPVNYPINGAIKVFAFLSGMLLAYYIFSIWLFGFFPISDFTLWGLIGLASLIASYVVWVGRGKGWGSAFCSSLPISFLIAQGYPFFLYV
jgi:hypothetical protein